MMVTPEGVAASTPPLPPQGFSRFFAAASMPGAEVCRRLSKHLLD